MTTTAKRKGIVDQHAEMAAKAFANHQIETLLDSGLYRCWRCAKPGTRVYAFTITTTPGYLFVNGDIGDLIVVREPDMLQWARTAVKDISYFAGKVPHAIKTREYDSDVALAWLEEEISDARAEADGLSKRLEDLKDLLDFDPDNQHEFIQAVYDSGVADGCDFPDFNNWTSNFLWCREAVKWFIEHMEAPEPTP